MMQRIFHNVVEAGMNHPIVTGAIGVVSSMAGDILIAVTDAEVTLESYDDWSVRIATTVGIAVSLLTIYILLGKVWRESTIFRPSIERTARKLRVMWYRRSLVYHKIRQMLDRMN